MRTLGKYLQRFGRWLFRIHLPRYVGQVISRDIAEHTSLESTVDYYGTEAVVIDVLKVQGYNNVYLSILDTMPDEGHSNG